MKARPGRPLGTDVLLLDLDHSVVSDTPFSSRGAGRLGGRQLGMVKLAC
jgi:hypothetical protein